MVLRFESAEVLEIEAEVDMEHKAVENVEPSPHGNDEDDGIPRIRNYRHRRERKFYQSRVEYVASVARDCKAPELEVGVQTFHGIPMLCLLDRACAQVS